MPFQVGILRAAVWLLLGRTVLRSKLIFCSWQCPWVLLEPEQQFRICLGLTVSHFPQSPAQVLWVTIELQICFSLENQGGRGRKDKDHGLSGEEKLGLQVKVISWGSKGENSSKACSSSEERSTCAITGLLPSPETNLRSVSEAVCSHLWKPCESQWGLRPAASANPGAHQKGRPPDPRHQKLHFNKTPK